MPATRDGSEEYLPMAWIISDYSKWKRQQIRGLICSGAELSDQAATEDKPSTDHRNGDADTGRWRTFVPDTSRRGNQVGDQTRPDQAKLNQAKPGQAKPA